MDETLADEASDDEVKKRFELIHDAVLKLDKDMDSHGFYEITDFIEALCRWEAMPLEMVSVPPILQKPDGDA